MAKRQYEVVVKVGPMPDETSFGWASIKSYYRDGLDAARNKRDEEQRKDRSAVIHIRDAETLRQAG